MLHAIADSDLRLVERAIIDAVRNARDLGGNKIMIATMDARRLRQSAKIAVAMAIGDDVWDDAEVLKVPAPKRLRGFVEIEE